LLALSAPAALAVHLAGPRGSDALTVTFLAVGHGDAVVLSSRGHHALVDGGGVPQGQDTGRRFVLPFLRQQRISRLDLAVLSHAHPDHALGLISALEELPTERLWLPADVGSGPIVQELVAAAGDAAIEEQETGAGSLRLGAARIEVLGPPLDRSQLAGENDRSVVLLVRHGDVTFLLLGDVEAAGEAALEVGAVTVVKAAHHGSNTSSTPELVAKTSPRHVVFCVGRHNRFDFPRPDVVRRWQATGAACHRTDLDGAITFTSDGHDVSVQTFHPPGARQARTLRAE
jgi:competence protein ComEC